MTRAILSKSREEFARDVSFPRIYLYDEMNLRELESMEGFIMGGHNLNKLRYAGDTVLIAQSKEKLQSLQDRVVEKSKNMGLTINCKRTEYIGNK